MTSLTNTARGNGALSSYIGKSPALTRQTMEVEGVLDAKTSNPMDENGTDRGLRISAVDADFLPTWEVQMESDSRTLWLRPGTPFTWLRLRRKCPVWKQREIQVLAPWRRDFLAQSARLDGAFSRRLLFCLLGRLFAPMRGKRVRGWRRYDGGLVIRGMVLRR